MTDRICIASKGEKQVHISTEDLLTCCESCGFGCNGGFPSSAWDYFKGDGIVTGGPYNSHKGCQPYTIPACDHHVPHSKNPCNGSLPTPQCKRSCEEGKLFSVLKNFYFLTFFKHFTTSITFITFFIFLFLQCFLYFLLKLI